MELLSLPSNNAVQRAPWFRIGIAGLMLALFVSVHAMAAFHTLHESVCEHTEAADHQCAVTLLAAGQVDVPVAGVQVVRIEIACVVQVSVSLPPFASTDRLDPPGRAPPVSLL